MMSIKQEAGTVVKDMTPERCEISAKGNDHITEVKPGCLYKNGDTSSQEDLEHSQSQGFMVHHSGNGRQLNTLIICGVDPSQKTKTDGVSSFIETEASETCKINENQSTITSIHSQPNLLVCNAVNLVKTESSMSHSEETGNELQTAGYSEEVSREDRWSLNLFQNQQHQFKHHVCDRCPYSSNFLFEVCQHKMSHKLDSIYICDLCQATYKYYLDLKTHLVSHAVDTLLLSELCDGNSTNNHKGTQTCEKPYSCDEFRLHKKKHRIEKPILCEFCGYLAADSKSLNRHIVMQTDGKPFSCAACDYTCLVSCQLDMHKATHGNESNNLFSCSVCDYRGKTSQNLKKHIARKHTGEKSFTCDDCDFVCGKKRELIKHRKLHAEREKPYVCDQCGYKCTQPHRLKKHFRIHTGEKPYSCEFCDFTCVEAGGLTQHRRTHTGEKPYLCEFCGISFKDSQVLKNHSRMQEDGKPYSCKFCDFTCLRMCQLKMHKASKHWDQKPFACSLCDYRCMRRFNLKEHERKHTGEKPYACHLCDHRSVRAGDLRVHIRTHTGERHACDQCSCTSSGLSDLNKHKKKQHNFVKHMNKKTYSTSCEFCDYTTKYPNNLIQHRRLHTGEKPYLCDFCGMSFTHAISLKKHSRMQETGKPYFCKFCDFTCLRMCQLRMHKASKHWDQKPYACSLCDYRCNDRYSFKVHERKHTGEKPYACDLCNYRTIRANDLTKHRKTHTHEQHAYDQCSLTSSRLAILNKLKKKETCL